MTTRWNDSGRFNAQGKLVGSYTLTPTYWLSTAISMDTAGGTGVITITGGHTLVQGDVVCFTYQLGRSNNIPTGSPAVIAGKGYYVRQVSGNTFKISTTNDDTNIVNFTGAGTSGKWRLEKASTVGSITLSNLGNLSGARVVLKNGGYNASFPSLNFQFNGVTDADAYHYSHNSSSGLGADMYLYHGGSNNPIRFFAIADFICRNGMITGGFPALLGWDGTSQSAIGITTVNGSGSAGWTKVDSRFNSINSISFYIGNVGSLPFCGFNGDFTMEVYSV